MRLFRGECEKVNTKKNWRVWISSKAGDFYSRLCTWSNADGSQSDNGQGRTVPQCVTCVGARITVIFSMVIIMKAHKRICSLVYKGLWRWLELHSYRKPCNVTFFQHLRTFAFFLTAITQCILYVSNWKLFSVIRNRDEVPTTIERLYSGYTVAIERLYSGYTLAIQRLYSGYT